MKSISHKTLLNLAGDAAYKRGEAYYYEGRVGDLRIKGNTITADVTGTEVYRVTLKHTASVFEGSCDCPASEGFDFCKHCVAAALVYLEQRQTREALYDSKAGDLLKNYLSSLDKSELVKELEELIEDDKLLREKWTLKAQAAAGKLDHKAFKKSITRAIPVNRHLYGYPEVRHYFAGVEQVVEKLAGTAAQLDPEQLLTLIDYALQRIGKALETVDDSGGFRYPALETLGECHVQTLARVTWPPEKMAAYLLKIYFSPDYDFYPEIPGAYLSVLSDKVLESFNAELQAEWDKLPPLQPVKSRADVDWDTKWKYLRIQGPLLAAAKAKQGLDTQIKLLVKTATSSNDYNELSKLCLDHDRLDGAIEWLEQAQRQHCREGARYMDQRLLEQEIAVLCYQKNFGEALQLRWKHFQQQPDLETYRELRKMAKLAKDRNDWYANAVAYLQDKKDTQWNKNDLTAQLHLEEKKPELALDLAEQNKINPAILLQIIRVNKKLPERILPLYIRLAEYQIGLTNNDAYHEAINLLQEAEKVLKGPLRKTLHKEIARLHNNYKAKRNFKKWLEEAFQELLC